MNNISNDYLKKLKINKKFKLKKINCEICLSKNHEVFVHSVSMGGDKYSKLNYNICKNCSHLFLNPIFEKKFYDFYYDEYYKNIAKRGEEPNNEFLNDQFFRGKKLKNFLYKELKIKKIKSLLDIGCSAGANLLPFKKDGTYVEGFDPDRDYVNFGKEKYNLNIYHSSAEEYVFKRKHYDLILILGSLEHVYDLNFVMKKINKVAVKNTILCISGRGRPKNFLRKFFNHNHMRIFTNETLELLMLKYGWIPNLTTFYNVTGKSRPNNIFCFANYDPIKSKGMFDKTLKLRRNLHKNTKYNFKFYDDI